MVTKFFFLFLVIFALVISAPVSASALNLPDIGKIPSLLGMGDENKTVSSSFIYDEGTGRWSAYNCGDNILLSTDGSGTFSFESEIGDFSFSLSGIGRYDNLFAPGTGRITIDGEELLSVHNGFSEWYINKGDGIEHGMDILYAPPGTGKLISAFEIAGEFIPLASADGQTIYFSDKNGPVFSYGGIYATDAEGKSLDSCFGFSGETIYWEIDDTDAVYPVTIDPVFGLIKKLRSSEYMAAGDRFGSSVSVSGDYAIVGANCNNTFGTDAGAAYIFKKDGSGNWGLVQKLQSTDYIQKMDQFGFSVSVSCDYAIVGAPDNETAGDFSGAAYIFKNDGSDNWALVQKLQSTDYIGSYDHFGNSVSVSGDYAIVGAPYNDTAGGCAGAAYIFKNNVSGGWGLVQKLQSTDYIGEDDNFGNSVSVSGDYAVVGAVGDKTAGSNSGAAYIFKNNGSDNWGLVQKLQSSEYMGSGDWFGRSVSVSGDYAIVGANWNNTFGTEAGAAYIFKNDGSDNWALVQKLQSSEYMAAGDRFGSSVSVSGDYAVVGAYWNDTVATEAGAAYIFKNDGSDNWGLVQKLQSTDYIREGDNFGCSVSLSGGYVIVGASYNDTAGDNSGAAYIFGIMPDFTLINPATGVNINNALAVQITGTNFTAGVQVKIVNNAATEIAAIGEALTGTTQIDCTLDLNGAAAGADWDVVITNTDGGSVTATDAFTVTVAPTPTPAPTSAPSGGGSNTNTGVGASQNMKAGDTASFNFENKGAVDELSVNVSDDTPSLMVTVKRQSSLPSSIANTPETDVYEYENVLVYHADVSAISGGVFEFKVSKSWLSSKGYTMGDVVMLHYKDDVWNSLPTEFAREEDGYYYYKAETPSFSWFAIAIGEGETIIPEETPEVMAAQTDVPAATEIITAATTPPVPTEGGVHTESQSSLVMSVILVIVIILLIITGTGLWQRKQKSKYPEWWDKKL